MRTPFSIPARIASLDCGDPADPRNRIRLRRRTGSIPWDEIARSDRMTLSTSIARWFPSFRSIACRATTRPPRRRTCSWNPADMLKGGESGPAVVPESPRIRSYSNWPPIDRSPACPQGITRNAVNLPQDLGLLALWIDQGAPHHRPCGGAESPGSPRPPGSLPSFPSPSPPDGQSAAAGRGNRIDLYHLPTGTWVDPHRSGIGIRSSPGLGPTPLRSAPMAGPRPVASSGNQDLDAGNATMEPAAILQTAVVGTNGSRRSPDGLRVAT